MKWRRYVAAALIGASVAIMALDFAAMYVMREAGILYRPMEVEDLAQVGANIIPLEDPSALLASYPASDPAGVMSQMAAAITCQGPDDGPDPEDAYALQAKVEAGEPILCAGIADLYASVMTAKGFEVRRVELLRSMMADADTHAVVEVREQGRWVLYDPTHSTTYEVAGRRLGAQGIKERFLNGGIEEVQAVEHGTPASGVSWSNYYMRWQPLFDNVIVWEKPVTAAAFKLPVLRWLYGRRAYYEVVPGHAGGQMHALELINGSAVFWAPIISFAMLAVAVPLLIPWKRLFRREPRA